jgi:SAM-dependent methyltransferase
MSDEVEFDHIAPVYDETRRPPTVEEVEVLVELLAGCRTVLDAGVGTGRFAVPLGAHQFEVVGVDLSLGMMQRARGKGITRLVRADVLHLPFADHALDAAFMAHVLQLIADPRPALRELGRVARTAVVLQLPDWSGRGPSGVWRQVGARYRALAAELGYPLPPRGERHWHTLEELSAIAPPKVIRILTGPEPTERSWEKMLDRWETRAFGTRRIPPEVHAEILRRIREEFPVPPSPAPRPRTARFLAWQPRTLEELP